MLEYENVVTDNPTADDAYIVLCQGDDINTVTTKWYRLKMSEDNFLILNKIDVDGEIIDIRGQLHRANDMIASPFFDFIFARQDGGVYLRCISPQLGVESLLLGRDRAIFGIEVHDGGPNKLSTHYAYINLDGMNTEIELTDIKPDRWN